MSLLTSSVRNHLPPLLIPMVMGSNFFLSMYSAMLRAELMDTPCSTERPPNKMATFFFLGIHSNFRCSQDNEKRELIVVCVSGKDAELLRIEFSVLKRS